MPSRPDLRELSSNVRDAFAECDRDALLEILTFVVKEYVVEGPPPMLVHPVEGLADLAHLSFAQLVTALQTRLEHPELGLFVVDGEQVSVRIGGVMQPLLASRQPAAELPRPASGVRVVEGGSPAATTAAAPRPSQPPTLRGRPDAGRVPAPSVGAPATGPASDAAAPSPSAAPASPPAAPAKPEGDSSGGDDSAARFSLLELD
jgi:hypothetical protein